MHSGSLEPTEPMCSNKSLYTAANSLSQLHPALKPMDSGLLKPGRHSLKRNRDLQFCCYLGELGKGPFFFNEDGTERSTLGHCRFAKCYGSWN